MIGTTLIEELVQAVAISHRLKDHARLSLLLIAAPESGKTTITTAAHCKHVCRIAVITGRSILREMKEHKHTEFFLFNDLSAIRAMSASAVGLLVTLLNQITQNEHGLVGFAGKDTEQIDRQIGLIGCIPFATFIDHRARWKELGFVSRMIPFAYAYRAELVAEIKDTIDDERHAAMLVTPKIPSGSIRIKVTCSATITRRVRHLADARAITLGQIGIRLLQHYHSLIRAHALLHGRHTVTKIDLDFLRLVDRYVSITTCTEI